MGSIQQPSGSAAPARPERFDHHAAMAEKTRQVPTGRKKLHHFHATGDAHYGWKSWIESEWVVPAAPDDVVTAQVASGAFP